MIGAWQRATHRLLSALDAELAELGLGAAEVNALAALADGPRTARELAEATAQRPSTLTGVLDRLERRGLVARRPNPRDRRSTLIAPTARGRAQAAQVTAAFARVAARIAGHVPAAEVAAVIAGVEQALAGPPPPPRSAPRR